MGFLNWFRLNEQEQVADAPDINKVLYIACVLTYEDQSMLLNLSEDLYQRAPQPEQPQLGHVEQHIPANWSRRAHHMTVKRPGTVLVPDLQNNPMMGQFVMLRAEYAVVDGDAMAIAVAPEADFPLQNDDPHITIAFSQDVNAAYSNTLLKNAQQKIPMTAPLRLRSYYVAVGRNQAQTWPTEEKLRVRLASPKR